MKKTITLFTFVILCFSSRLLAQPVLTATDLNPVGGETYQYFYTFSNSTITNYGDTGINATWDFHNDFFYPADTIVMINCSSTNLCGSFPGSNIVEVYYPFYGASSGADTDYQFLSTTPANLCLQGEMTRNGLTSTATMTGNVELKYPLVYNSTFDTNYTIHSVDPNQESYEHGTVRATYDGYGTILLPQAIHYTNASRLHFVYNAIDSVYTNAWVVYRRHVDQYYWYRAGFHNTLCFASLEQDSVGQTSLDPVYSMSYNVQIPLAVSTVNTDNLSVNVYPNPAKDQFSIKFDLAQEHALSITLTDLLGRQVGCIANKSFTAGMHQLNYNCAVLPRGLYLLHIQGDGISTTRKMDLQ